MTKDIDTSDLIPEEIAGLGRRYVDRWQTNRLNVQTYELWRHKFYSIALAAFEWDNLPELIDPRYLEIVLLYYGMGGFFDMSGRRNLGMYAFAQATPLGNPNMYLNPNKVQLIPPNGRNQWVRYAYYHVRTLLGGDYVIEEPDSIVCFDNIRRIPLVRFIDQQAMRIARIDRIIDINMGAQATPWILETIEERAKDAVNLAKQLSGFEPLIIKYKTKDAVETKVLNLEAPYVADRLIADRNKLINDTLTLLGVDNSNTEKRERATVGETESNDEFIMLMRASRIECRRRFCEQVNKRWGLDLDVHYAIRHTDDNRADKSYYDDPASLAHDDEPTEDGDDDEDL